MGGLSCQGGGRTPSAGHAGRLIGLLSLMYGLDAQPLGPAGYHLAVSTCRPGGCSYPVDMVPSPSKHCIQHQTGQWLPCSVVWTATHGGLPWCGLLQIWWRGQMMSRLLCACVGSHLVPERLRLCSSPNDSVWATPARELSWLSGPISLTLLPGTLPGAVAGRHPDVVDCTAMVSGLKHPYEGADRTGRQYGT